MQHHPHPTSVLMRMITAFPRILRIIRQQIGTERSLISVMRGDRKAELLLSAVATSLMLLESQRDRNSGLLPVSAAGDMEYILQCLSAFLLQEGNSIRSIGKLYHSHPTIITTPRAVMAIATHIAILFRDNYLYPEFLQVIAGNLRKTCYGVPAFGDALPAILKVVSGAHGS